ncbi:MAG: copper chaperone PCu(A)C [Candidatus Eisenbacteria bacterium]|nr:copper chaperone PCu(A)C [Candidatus Eisenbacteria bacterium]
MLSRNPRNPLRAALTVLAVATLIGCSGGAARHGADSGAAPGAPVGVHVENAWLRPVEPGQTTAGYFTLVNDSEDSLTLVGVEIPAAEMSMMHETVKDSAGAMRMQEVGQFVVAPRGRLEFTPGGNHVMAMQAYLTLAEGDTTGLFLHFADGRRMHVTANVQP